MLCLMIWRENEERSWCDESPANIRSHKKKRITYGDSIALLVLFFLVIILVVFILISILKVDVEWVHVNHEKKERKRRVFKLILTYFPDIRSAMVGPPGASSSSSSPSSSSSSSSSSTSSSSSSPTSVESVARLLVQSYIQQWYNQAQQDQSHF